VQALYSSHLAKSSREAKQRGPLHPTLSTEEQSRTFLRGKRATQPISVLLHLDARLRGHDES